MNKIKSITLQIDDQEITISAQDAKELYNELQKLFGNPQVAINPLFSPNLPNIVNPTYLPTTIPCEKSPPWERWKFTCNSTGEA